MGLSESGETDFFLKEETADFEDLKSHILKVRATGQGGCMFNNYQEKQKQPHSHKEVNSASNPNELGSRPFLSQDSGGECSLADTLIATL